MILVEGRDELKVALDSGAWPQELYYCPELMAHASELVLLERMAGVGALELSREAFEKAAYRESPDGWLAVFPGLDTSLEHLSVPENALVLVCESVEKPGNLGAMLRTAAAVGVDAVIAPAAVTDWSNPNVVRASKGTIFTVPVAEAESAELVAWLRAKGIKLVAAAPRVETVYWDADFTGGVALAVGAEHEGLSRELLAAADVRVQIPMQGDLDSLNAATSAALLMYEAMRQRR